MRRVSAIATAMLVAGVAACEDKTTTEARAVAILNHKTPVAGVLTGGQPTEVQLTELQQAGYKTVINLRTPGEKDELPGEGDKVAALGMRYVAIPVKGEATLDVANAQKLHAALAEPGALPAVVHCGSGDRVGAMFAVRAHGIEKVPAGDALELGKRAGLEKLEPQVRSKLGL